MKTIVNIFCTILVLSTPAVAASPQGMPPANVEVITLKKVSMVATSDTAASVISLNDTKIASEVAGRMLWIAKVGDQVKKGQVIARIDQSLLLINLQRAKAKVARLKADMIFRTGELARQKQLSRNDFASKSRLQAASSQRDMTQADLLSAQADLMAAKRDLALGNIKAPFDGHVAGRMESVGNYVSKGDQILRLVDTHQREVQLSAPIRYLPFVRGLNTMMVKDSAGQVANFDIRAVVPVGDAKSRQVEIRLTAKETAWPKGWIIGAPLTAVVPSSPNEIRIGIPREALIIQGSSMIVYKLMGGKSAVPVTVMPLYASGPMVALKGEPLKAGEKIIIKGGERLMPGQPLNVIKK